MKNVLVIEDNEQNLYLVTFILKQGGFQVIQALNGQDGLKLAFETKPDLILLDIQLPVMDGYTVAKELRKNYDLNNIPIIAVTSYAMTGDREKAFEAGCNDYISKPFSQETFMELMKKYLKK